VGLPSRKGELANSAVAIGCSAMPRRAICTMSASSTKSRLTCEPVAHVLIPGPASNTDARPSREPAYACAMTSSCKPGSCHAECDADESA
jgi:hypothetical protein